VHLLAERRGDVGYDDTVRRVVVSTEVPVEPFGF
jgi:hypothetical protein